VRDRRGATAIEYALIATIVSIAIAATQIGANVTRLLNEVGAGFH
jgi:Flp pilus assembly pilin Flp